MTKDPVAIRVIGKYGDTPRGPIASSSIIGLMSIMEITDPVVIVNVETKKGGETGRCSNNRTDRNRMGKAFSYYVKQIE